MSELKPCQMTNEVAAQWLAQRILCEEKVYTAEFRSAVELAIDALRRAKPTNEPLTLEQLREMDGDPVWCEDTANYSGIIKLAEDWGTEKPEAHIWTFDEEGNPKCHNVRLMMEFGAKFYRRKPKEGD